MHLIGFYQTAYSLLVKAFGKPEPGDKYKISSQWTLKTPNGKTFTIYDWKLTRLYQPSLPTVSEFRSLKSHYWNIGGEDTDLLSITSYLDSVLRKPKSSNVPDHVKKWRGPFTIKATKKESVTKKKYPTKKKSAIKKRSPTKKKYVIKKRSPTKKKSVIKKRSPTKKR